MNEETAQPAPPRLVASPAEGDALIAHLLEVMEALLLDGAE